MRRLPSKQPTSENSHSDVRQSKSSTSSIPSASDCKMAEHEARDDESQVVEGAEYGFVELNLISAQGLKDVKMFGNMSPYAVIWIDPSCKHRTCISDNTGSSPVWDHFLRFPVPIVGNPDLLMDSDATSSSKTNSLQSNDNANADNDEEDGDDHQRLTIQIFSQGALSDVLVGTAHIPLQDIIQNATGKLQYLACQLVRPSGRIQGLVNLSVQFKAPSLPHDSLPHHPHGKGTRSHPGQSRNSWFFLAEGMEEEGGREGAAAALQARPIAAPDFLDFKAEGEGVGACGTVSRSSSSANESVNASAPHSPTSSNTEFFNVSPMQQPHQHEHQQAGASKAMFDNAFDALVIADVANDLAAMSMLQADRGSQSVGDALLGLAMSQSLQSNNAPFGPSSS